jgi:hypothetical protein
MRPAACPETVLHLLRAAFCFSENSVIHSGAIVAAYAGDLAT